MLKPDSETNQIFAYCLAYAVKKTNMKIHYYMVMSNHYHCILTDPEGKLPEFVECLHKLVAKCMNAKYGRWENFWSTYRYDLLFLPTREEVLGKIVYAAVNPVRAWLVDDSEQWLGLRTKLTDYQRGPIMIKKPAVYFRDNGDMPEEIPLEVEVPPMFDDMSKEEFVALLGRMIEEAEEQKRNEERKANRKPMGIKRVLAQSIYDTPESFEPRRRIIPKFASKDKALRLEMIRMNRAFVEEYKIALGEFRAGNREVLFPPGTYWMKRFMGVKCRPWA
jgi:REP element-mobilizing transposase RayT